MGFKPTEELSVSVFGALMMGPFSIGRKGCTIMQSAYSVFLNMLCSAYVLFINRPSK